MKFFTSRHKISTVSISNDTIIRAILIAIGALITLRVLSSLTHQLTLIGVSVFLAMALNPAVAWITRQLKVKSRGLATGIAYLIVLGVLITFSLLVVPPLVRQTTDFVRDIPQTITEFRDQDSTLARSLHKYKLDDQLDKITHELNGKVGNLSGPVLSTAGRIGGTLISIITVLVLTFMLLVEGPVWISRIWAMQPADERERRKKVAYKMYRVVTGYVNGQVLIAAIAATFAAVALVIGSSLANVTVNPMALAGIVFLFGLIPLIGNTLAAAIVVLFCLFVSPGLAVGMAVYFLVYQQVENATLQPYIQARSNNLTPLIVFVSALIGASLGGLLGALAAIPLAGCIRVIFDEYFADHLPTAETIENAEIK